MAIYPDEFLFRFRPPDSPQPPAWHFVLAGSVKDPFGKEIQSRKVMSMKQAEEEGWALPEICAAINTHALREAERLAKALEEERAEKSKLANKLAQLELNHSRLRDLYTSAAMKKG